MKKTSTNLHLRRSIGKKYQQLIKLINMKKASTNLHLGLPIRGRYQSLKSCILSGKVNRSSFGEEKIVESTTLPTHFPEFRIAQKVNDWVPHGGRLGE